MIDFNSIPSEPYPPAVLAYVSGFLDGEGSVMIRKRGHRWEAHVRFVNTVYPIMHWLAELTGGSLSRRKPGGRSIRPSYEVNLQHKKAEKWAALMLPYTFIKRDELSLLLEFRRSIELNRRRRPVDPAIEVLRHEIVASCKTLKNRLYFIDSTIGPEAVE